MRKIILLLFVSCFMFNVLCLAQEMGGVKKAVMIIAADNFRDDELFPPKEILENNGIEVKIASTVLTSVKGALGTVAKPDILVSDINVNDFQAIIFVGGPGATQYWDDPTAHQLAQFASNTQRVVAAICIAPITLAKAGILTGKRATVHPSEEERLKSYGVDYTARPVERDGNIITASGPQAAVEFGQEIVKALKF